MESKALTKPPPCNPGELHGPSGPRIALDARSRRKPDRTV
jgi:hypothetical protein